MRKALILLPLLMLLISLSIVELTPYTRGYSVSNIVQQGISETPISLHVSLYSQSKSRNLTPIDLFKAATVFIEGFEAYSIDDPPLKWISNNAIVTDEDRFNGKLDSMHSLKIMNGYAYKELYVGRANLVDLVGGISFSFAYKVVEGDLVVTVSTGDEVIARVDIGDRFVVNSVDIDRSSRGVWGIVGIFYLPRDGSIYVWKRGGFFKVGYRKVDFNGYITIKFEADKSYIDTVVVKVAPPMTKAAHIVDPLFSPIVDVSPSPMGDKLALLSAWGFVAIYDRSWRLLNTYVLDVAGIQVGYVEWITDDIVFAYTLSYPMRIGDYKGRYGIVYVFNVNTGAENSIVLPLYTQYIHYGILDSKSILLYYFVRDIKADVVRIYYMLLNSSTLSIVDEGLLLNFKEPEVLMPFMRRMYSSKLVLVDEELDRVYVPTTLRVSFSYKGYYEYDVNGLYLYAIDIYNKAPSWITRIASGYAEAMFLEKLAKDTFILIYYTKNTGSEKTYSTHICLVNATNGAIIWSSNIDVDILSPIYANEVLSAHVLGDIVYITASDGVVAIDYRSGSLVWFNNTVNYMDKIIKSIEVGNGIVLVGSNGKLYLLENNVLKHYMDLVNPFFGYSLKNPMVYYNKFNKKFYVCSNGLLYVYNRDGVIDEIYGLPDKYPYNIVYGGKSVILFYAGYKYEQGLIVRVDYSADAVQYLPLRDLGLTKANGLLYNDKYIVVYGENRSNSLIIWLDYGLVETGRIVLEDTVIEDIRLTKNGYVYYVIERDNNYVLGKAFGPNVLWEKILPLDRASAFANRLSIYGDNLLVYQIPRYSSEWRIIVYNGSGEEISDFSIDISRLPQNRFYIQLVKDKVAILGIIKGFNAAIYIYDLNGKHIYNKTIPCTNVEGLGEFRVVNDVILVSLPIYNSNVKTSTYYIALMNPSNGDLTGAYILGTPIDIIVDKGQLYVLKYRWYEEWYSLLVDLEKIVFKELTIDLIEYKMYTLFRAPRHLRLSKTVVSERVQSTGLLSLSGLGEFMDDYAIIYTYRGFFNITSMNPPVLYTKDVYDYENETRYSIEVYNPSPIELVEDYEIISFTQDDYGYYKLEVDGWYNGLEYYSGYTYTLLASRLSPLVKEFSIRDGLGRAYDVYIPGVPIDVYLELWDRGSVVDKVSVYINDRYIGSGWNISFNISVSGSFVLKIVISDLSGNELVFSKTLYINNVGSIGGGIP